MLTGNGHAKTTLSWSPKGATAATAVTLWLRWEPWGEVFALVRWLIRSTQIWNHRSTSIVLTNSRLSSPCVATAVLTHPRGTNCSLSSYLCPAVCFQEILFKQARTCHWNQLNFSDTSASRAHERISLFINTGKGIWLSYVYFGSNRPSYTRAVFNSSGARLRELCQWGGTKLSQGDFLLVKSYVGTLSLEPSDTSMLPLLTNMLHTNVLWNMLLEGSSVRVLQCSPLPTDTGAVFNSFSKQSCPHAHCSLSSYLCPAVCFQEILFKQARTCQLNFSDTSASWAHERVSLFINTGKGIWLSYVYFGSNRPSYTRAVFNSSGARLRELCQWGGTKLSQGDFLLAHYH